MNIDEAWKLWENTFMAITKRFPKGVLPRKQLPWVTAGTIDMQFQNTISYTTNWPNNPNLRAEYKQLYMP